MASTPGVDGCATASSTLDPARAPRDYPELLWARPEDLRTSSLVAVLD